ncbi:MAG: flagellar biosynthesis protein FlgJ [Legionella sp.]|nr:MAG: flagellar biosynthesis protein FlgJ [Legionella sp.]
MDVSVSAITLHPQAKTFLFEHYFTLKRVFSDVIGLLEIDYLSIALITRKNELLFFSSSPGIESNLIEHNLWQLDKSYHEEFIQSAQAQWWDVLYPKGDQNNLRHYKQEAEGFSIGLAIPAHFEQFRVVYSLALKSRDETIKNKLQNEIDNLVNMGKFCLMRILKKIPLPSKQRSHVAIKPILKLVISNK